MKALKITYYIIWSICSLLFIMYMCAAGPLGTYHYIMYGQQYVMIEHTGISVTGNRFKDNHVAQLIHSYSIIITAVHFVSLTLCALTMAFYKMDLRRKYLLGISFGLIATLGTLLAKLLWRYLVKAYLGI